MDFFQQFLRFCCSHFFHFLLEQKMQSICVVLYFRIDCCFPGFPFTFIHIWLAHLHDHSKCQLHAPKMAWKFPSHRLFHSISIASQAISKLKTSWNCCIISMKWTKANGEWRMATAAYRLAVPTGEVQPLEGSRDFCHLLKSLTHMARRGRGVRRTRGLQLWAVAELVVWQGMAAAADTKIFHKHCDDKNDAIKYESEHRNLRLIAIP